MMMMMMIEYQLLGSHSRRGLLLSSPTSELAGGIWLATAGKKISWTRWTLGLIEQRAGNIIPGA